MIKKMTCIECPKGCLIKITLENLQIVKIDGNICIKGKTYAGSEINNPLRIVTSSVLALGLPLKMIPVRTDKPVSKDKIFEVMSLIKKVRVTKPVYAGDIIVTNILQSGANLIATRDVPA
ncbi:DUF1667 domain-containing protein [Candidatus Desantisbacteria bacterium]|nr:DUF1667 domain-containing protein [Candidatus Desantisbacteria bacterium]